MSAAEGARSSASRGSASERSAHIDPLTGSPVYVIPPSAPRRGAVALRPFGYLGMTVVWLVVFFAAVFGTVLVLPVQLASGLGSGGLAAAPGLHHSDSWLAFIVIPFIVVPILGFMTVFLVLACLGMLLASATLFVRSLNPAYRGERLSGTVRSVNGEAVGPPTTAATGVALSLLPLRLTRWSKVVMIIQFNGWIMNANQFVIGVVWGVLYVFTVGWTLWPASGVAVVVCVILSAALAAWLVVTIWRRRGRYADVMPDRLRATVYAASWPNTPPAKESAGRGPADK